MNLQRILLAARCAALVALCLAGARLISPGPISRERQPSALHGAAALEQLKQAGQYESLQAAMGTARFGVSRVERTPLGRAAWQAPNAAAGYDAYVTETGVSLAVKKAEDDQSLLSLSLESIGYGSALHTVRPGVVSGDKQAINIEREGVREWFINSADGLEHGFTLSQRPEGWQAGVPLRLALQVGAGWHAVADNDGQRVSLHSSDNEVVEYGKLIVRDSAGSSLQARLTVGGPTRLAVDGEQVVIEVEDANAEYPLTIDPLFTLQQRLMASDGAADDYFGHAVALDGNTALIGVPYDDVTATDQGSAYVFVRNGATWTFQQRLVANDAGMFDLLGWAVALDGDTAVVGAYNGPGPASGDQGAAYVFVRSGTTWTQQKRLNASDGVMAGLFGTAVAISGDTVLVGASNFRTNANFIPGTVYVYVRNGTAQPVWTEQTKLFASDVGNEDWFGAAVAIEGDTVLVGAPSNTVTVANQGAAYIFTRSGSAWTQQQPVFTAPNPSANDQFGNAVALSGDKALVGVPGYGSDDHGQVVTLVRAAAGWTRTVQFAAPNPKPGANFGMSVDLDGDTALVGASLRLFQSGADQRSAYAFIFNLGWQYVREFGPGLGSTDDRFGYAVALDGDAVLIGAYRANTAATAQGTAYVFTLHDSRHNEQQKLFANDGFTGDRFGNSVALDSDTLAVGAEFATVNNRLLQGEVYIFVRNGAGWTFQQKISAPDGLGGDQFGHSVALDGDTLAVGAYHANVGNNANQGAAYIFTRNGTAWSFQQKLTAVGIDGLPNYRLGESVALRGQTVLAGAPGYNQNRGAVFVFTRNGVTWMQQPKLTANDAAVNNEFGSAVALDGDTAAVGAWLAHIGTKQNQGAAYLFTGGGASWAFQQKVTASDGAAFDYFGSSVALRGDTVAVGAPFAKIGTQGAQGAAYVFTRSGMVWTQSPKLIAADGSQGDRFGQTVALGDGILAVGAPYDNQARGAAYTYTNNSGNWFFQQKLVGSDTARDDYFGSSVAMNGDTVAVGATGDDFSDGVDKGAAYLFGSPGCPAINVAPLTLAEGVQGVGYNQPLTVSGGASGEYRFAVVGGALPPGVTIAGDQGLTGTPTTPGTYRFPLKATYYASLCAGTRDYVITIASCANIVIAPPTLPNGAVGMAYSQDITASGGPGQYSVGVTAGALPPGLTLNVGGSLTGVPTQEGTYNFTVTGGSGGCTNSRSYTVTINPPCESITVNPPTLPGGAVGATYSQQLSATGSILPSSFSVVTGGLPPGLSLSTSGLLSGTPTQIGGFAFTIAATNANGCTGTRLYSMLVTLSTAANGLQFYPLAHPVRLLDTRVGFAGCDSPGAKIVGGTSRTQTAAGRTCDGLTIPANAAALVGNATSVQSGGGYFTLYPSDIAKPNSANSNYAANQILNSLFTVRLGANDGAFKIFVSSDTDIVVDITGYYAPPSIGGLYFHPLPKPVRLLDTRQGQSACFTPGAALQGDSTTSQIGTTTCDGVLIPAGALALTGNATTVSPQANGFLTLYPSNAQRPLIASANFQPGVNLNSPFMVGLSPSGQFNMYVASTTNLVIDVTGYYSTQLNDANGQGLLFNGLAGPVRLLDTRVGQTACFMPGAPMTVGTPYTQAAIGPCATVPTAARAVVGNATTVNATANGYLTFWPSDANQPFIATSNYRTGITFNRHFTVGLGPDGAFKRYVANTTDLVVDLCGYFAP